MGEPHKHAELIKAWAEGAEIEFKHRDGSAWSAAQVPTWLDDCDYRIKPEPKWYENIPKHGVLCRVNDLNPAPDCRCLLRVIVECDDNFDFKFTDHCGTEWRYATPLTNDEIRQFLREE